MDAVTEFYRFRSLKSLLGKWNELDNQTVYFASADQLNDPMEGYRDVVWRGDRIVWTNLFKHFAFCLHATFMKVIVTGGKCLLTAQDIPIRAWWDYSGIPEYGDLVESIWSRTLNECGMAEVIDKILAQNRSVREYELLFYLSRFHESAKVVIVDEYSSRGLLPTSDSEQWRPVKPTVNPLVADGFMDKLGRIERSKGDSVGNFLFDKLALKRDHEDRIAYKYARRGRSEGYFEKNCQMLFVDFHLTYVELIKDLLGPPWYTACFMRNYRNSAAWAHYGDEHKGVCLIFGSEERDGQCTLPLARLPISSRDSTGSKTVSSDWIRLPFIEVTYKKPAEEVDFFRSLFDFPPLDNFVERWYVDEDGNRSQCAPLLSESSVDTGSWVDNAWDDYILSTLVKTPDWSEEQEHRLSWQGLQGVLDQSERTFTYDFDYLKGIIFGLRTSDEDKVRILEIIERKCLEKNRTDFRYYQAYYDSDSGEIRSYPFAPKLTQ